MTVEKIAIALCVGLAVLSVVALIAPYDAHRRIKKHVSNIRNTWRS